VRTSTGLLPHYAPRLWLLAACGSAVSAVAAPEFKREIQPILENHCYGCHGPDKHKSGLRLDRKADALQGGDAGVVIVPGDSAKSPLYAHISGGEPDALMPPESENKPLSPAQIALIKAWIDEGAVWPDEAAVRSRDRRRPSP